MIAIQKNVQHITKFTLVEHEQSNVYCRPGLLTPQKSKGSNANIIAYMTGAIKTLKLKLNLSTNAEQMTNSVLSQISA